MVAPTTSANLAHSAIAALLTPALPAGTAVYAHGKVPSPLPQKFVLLTVERAYVESTHGVRARTRASFRAYVRAVADMKHNADDIADRCSGALEDAWLVIDGSTSTPVQHESSEFVRPDDGKFSGLTTFTFTL